MGGWRRCALVSPDGVARSRMDSVSASINLPLHHKVQKFFSGPGSPGWSGKKGRKTVVVAVVSARDKDMCSSHSSVKKTANVHLCTVLIAIYQVNLGEVVATLSSSASACSHEEPLWVSGYKFLQSGCPFHGHPSRLEFRCVRPSVRTSVRTSTKSFSDFHLTWCVRRARPHMRTSVTSTRSKVKVMSTYTVHVTVVSRTTEIWPFEFRQILILDEV